MPTTGGELKEWLWSPDPMIESERRLQERMSRAEYNRRLEDNKALKDPQNLLDENKLLRRMLCVAYAGARFYGDDGELQDNREFPHIDFRRDSAQEIHRKMGDRAQKHLIAYLQSLHTVECK